MKKYFKSALLPLNKHHTNITLWGYENLKLVIDILTTCETLSRITVHLILSIGQSDHL